MASTVDSPEVAAAKVAAWRASGKIPPAGVSVALESAPVKIGQVQQVNSGIGDCLKAAFDEYAIEFLPSCGCRALKEKLNRTKPENVEAEIEAHVEKIADNVQHATGWKGAILKVIDWASPDAVKDQIRETLLQCIAKAKSTDQTQAAD